MAANGIEDLGCCAPLGEAAAMTAEQAEHVAVLLKALADPVRLRLVSLIAASPGDEACVCDLNEAFPLTQATVSHHLKVLHSAGLLEREKRGVWVYYSVDRRALASVAAVFSPPERAGALA
jgi:ArsR family transcriptional regulator, arsenate/arsenite/antimonite-responsive transcriptional repressor